jgi:hypothetical protein
MAKVRVISSEFLEDGSGKKFFVYAGNSTAEKPVNDLIAMGSIFMENDTGVTYKFDEDAGEWTVPGGGNNGG